MADHNDPNAVNSIFSDVDVSAADLYDIFGYPSNDQAGGEKVVIALTFASVPEAGVLDPDMLYRIQIAPDERVKRGKDDYNLDELLEYFNGLKEKYLSVLKPAEVRVRVDPRPRAREARDVRAMMGRPSRSLTRGWIQGRQRGTRGRTSRRQPFAGPVSPSAFSGSGQYGVSPACCSSSRRSRWFMAALS